MVKHNLQTLGLLLAFVRACACQSMVLAHVDWAKANLSSRYKGSCLNFGDPTMTTHDLWPVHSSLWKIADVIRQCIPRIEHMLMFHSCVTNYQTLPNNKRKCTVLTRSHIVHLSYSLHPYCCRFSKEQLPIGSMYAIYGTIYHQYTPNVSIYTIHGSYGNYRKWLVFLANNPIFGVPENILIPSVNLSPRCQPCPNHPQMMLTWLGFLYV